MEKLIINEMCKKYGQSKKFVILLIKICKDNNVENTTNLIDKVCQKVCQNKKTQRKNATNKWEIKK